MVWQRSAIMKKALQQTGWISGTRRRTVNAAFALAVLIVSTVVVTRSVQAQSFIVLYTFTGGADGANPGGVIRDKFGNLYGTTGFGGTSDKGTVFKLDTAGTQTVLHSFTGRADGARRFAGLVRDKEGNLYGTTFHGDFFYCVAGCGVVFKLDTTDTETALYSFTGGPDGANPGGLARDKEGNLYGTTFR